MDIKKAVNKIFNDPRFKDIQKRVFEEIVIFGESTLTDKELKALCQAKGADILIVHDDKITLIDVKTAPKPTEPFLVSRIIFPEIRFDTEVKIMSTKDFGKRKLGTKGIKY